MSAHTLYAVETGGGLIDEIVSHALNLNSAQAVRGAGGAIEPQFISLNGQSPEMSFGTLAIARALALVGADGYAIPGGVNPAVVFFQKMLADGGREGTLKHLMCEVEKGLIVPRTLTANQGELAVLTYDIIARYDGTNEPFVFTDSQTLAGSPVADELFTLGPWSINGVEVPGMIGVTVDFGLEVHRQTTGGGIWPTFLSIKRRSGAKITGRTREAISLDTFGLLGTAQGVTDSVVFFRKKLIDGTGNVAEGTAEHVSVSVDAGNIRVEGASADHPEPYANDIIITPRYDGSNATLAIATATAISV